MLQIILLNIITTVCLGGYYVYSQKPHECELSLLPGASIFVDKQQSSNKQQLAQKTNDIMILKCQNKTEQMENKTISVQRHLHSIKPQNIHLGAVQYKFYIKISISNSTCNTEGYNFTVFRQSNTFDAPYQEYSNQLVFKQRYTFVDMLQDNEIYDLYLNYNQLYNYNREMYLSKIHCGLPQKIDLEIPITQDALMNYLDRKTSYFINYKYHILQKSQLRLRRPIYEDCKFDVNVVLTYEVPKCNDPTTQNVFKPPFMIKDIADHNIQYLNRVTLSGIKTDNEVFKLFITWAITLISSIIFSFKVPKQQQDKQNSSLFSRNFSQNFDDDEDSSSGSFNVINDDF